MKLGRRIREIQTGVCFEYRGREDYFAFRFAEDSFFTRIRNGKADNRDR